MHDNDRAQTMPSMDALLTKSYTPKEYLQYYKNIWTRNAVARTIDVKTDEAFKAEDPEMEVIADDGRPIKVKERLEHRKILVADALKLLKTVDALMAIENLEEAVWSEKALAVAEDMLPKEEDKNAKSYNVLKDFGDVKTGEVIKCQGWTSEQIADRIADGTISEVAVSTEAAI